MAAPTSAEISSALLYSNYWWSGSTVTYSIATAGGQWLGYNSSSEAFDSNFAAPSSALAARFAAAVESWDAVIGLNLTQTNDVISPGQIRFAFSDVDAHSDDGDLWGYAYSPPTGGGSGSAKAGDIWIDYAKASATFADTTYDYSATIHEIGHALGLKHPFEDGSILAGAYDTRRYTVMSYTDYADDVHRTVEATATGVRTAVQGVYATTPMVFDIAAIQARYGADAATGAGNTTYSWSQSAPMMQAVYDAGGIDTFDLSAHSRASIVDLTPGAYSSIAHFSASAQASYWTALYPWASSFISSQFNQASTYTWSNNLGIAFNTVIENVVGGSAGDSVTGNDAYNDVGGRLGNDSIDGAGGDDYLRGDEGDDRIVGAGGFDNINGNMGNDTVNGGIGDDWAVGGKDNDLLFGEDGADIVYGNLGDDTCDGAAGDDVIRGGQQNDILTGGAGNDWLSGDRNDDTITGGSGADIFHGSQDAGIDRITDFSLTDGDRVQLDPGTTYTLSQVGADTVVDMGGGHQMILAGVSASTLTAGWIFGA